MMVRVVSFVFVGMLISPSAFSQIEVTGSTFQGGSTAPLTGGSFSLSGTGGVYDGAAGLAGASFEHDGGYWTRACGGTIVSYGAGCPGTAGFVPKLTISGCPSAGDTEVFSVTEGLGGAQFFMMFGFGQAAVPIGGGCLLNVAAPFPSLIGPLPLLGAGPGGGALTFPIPVLPGYTQSSSVGLSFVQQVFVIDPSSPLGFVGTNGVEVTIG